METTRPSLSARLSLLLVSFVMAMGLAEGGLRLSGLTYEPSPDYHYDPDRGWVHNGGHSYVWHVEGEEIRVDFNQAGYRDHERQLTRPDGVRRVVVIGDSFTSAIEVNVEQTFSWKLDALLNERRQGTWEVLNLGVGDYGTAQELITLETVGLEYEPDVVVHQIFPLNDICNNSIALADLCLSRRDRVRPYFVEADGELVTTTIQPVRNWLRRHLQIVRVVERFYRVRVEGLSPEVPREEYGQRIEKAGLGPLWPLLHTFVEGDAQLPAIAAGWAMTERLLERSASVTHAAGAVYLPLVIPFHYRIAPKWEIYQSAQPPPLQSLDYPERRLGALFDRLGVASVMLRPELERNPDRFWPARSGHLNPWAHERTAEALFRAFVAAGLVSEKGDP